MSAVAGRMPVDYPSLFSGDCLRGVLGVRFLRLSDVVLMRQAGHHVER